MPTFDNPAADASKAEQALRGLAHATRRIEDPSQIYGVLGSLSRGIASLSQSLHQLGSGLLHEEVTVVSCSLVGCGGHDGLVLDGGQATEGGLPAAAVVGALDPGHDRDP